MESCPAVALLSPFVDHLGRCATILVRFQPAGCVSGGGGGDAKRLMDRDLSTEKQNRCRICNTREMRGQKKNICEGGNDKS